MPVQSCRADATPGQERIHVVWQDRRGAPTPDLAASTAQANPPSGPTIPLAKWVDKVNALGPPNLYEVVFTLPPAGRPQPVTTWLKAGEIVEFSFKFTNVAAQSVPCVVEPSGDGWTQVRDDIKKAAQQLNLQLNAANVNAFLAQGRTDFDDAKRLGKRAIGDSHQVRTDFDDLLGFPLGITSTDGGGGGGMGPGPGGGGQALVDEQFRRLLGRKPNPDDVTGTLALLDRAMELQVGEDGVERWELRTGGALVVQAASGAGITGRQASLAGIAHDTVEQVNSLVPKLTSLRTDVDSGRLSARRENFIASLTEAASQAANPGGPLALKSQVLLDQSLEQLGRYGVQLGVMRRTQAPVPATPPGPVMDVWVFVRTRIDTLDDEEEFTNFLIVVDRYRAFDDAFRAYLGLPLHAAVRLSAAAGGTDLGIVFTRLERRIDVLSEAVDELDAALASVGIDHEEREALTVKRNDDSTPTIADLMSWAYEFPEREARPLMQQGGLHGARLLPDRIRTLRTTVDLLRTQANSQNPQVPSGLRHQRVRNAIGKLRKELKAAENAASAI